MAMKDEREPFPEFLQTLSGLELAAMQREAREWHDTVVLAAVLAELKRRAVAEPFAARGGSGGSGGDGNRGGGGGGNGRSMEPLTERVNTTALPCHTCKWSWLDEGDEYPNRHCLHPQVQREDVAGDLLPSPLCRDVRAVVGSCGRQAKLHEQFNTE